MTVGVAGENPAGAGRLVVKASITPTLNCRSETGAPGCWLARIATGEFDREAHEWLDDPDRP